LAACQAHGKIIDQSEVRPLPPSSFRIHNWVEEPLSVTGSIKELPKNILSMYTGQNKTNQSKYYTAVCEPRKE